VTDSDWWCRAKLPPRPQPIEIRKRERLCVLRKGEHQITLEKRIMAGYGDEVILSVNAQWCRMRAFRGLSELGTALEETIRDAPKTRVANLTAMASD
jgi:hypothetical protein